MTKHVKPTSGSALTDAEAAFTAAEAELSAARGAVQVILDTQAGVMADRRWLDTNRPLAQRNPLDPSLNPQQRAHVQMWIDYDAAVAAEGRALGLLERARKNLDDLRDAARIAGLGDGRAALRDAIAVCSEAEKLHRENAEALDRAEAALAETYGLEGEAERALEKAKADAPSRLAAEYRGSPVEPGPTVEQAEAAVAAVQQKRAHIRDARDALETETRSTNARAGWERDKVKAAAVLVVKASPATLALVHAFNAAEQRFLTLRAALDVLGREGAVPDSFRSRLSPEPDRFLSYQWSAVIEGLRSDFDAPLPKVP